MARRRKRRARRKRSLFSGFKRKIKRKFVRRSKGQALFFWASVVFAIIVLAFASPFMKSVSEYIVGSFSDPVVKVIIYLIVPSFILLYFYFVFLER